jgi:hypothetical protein
MIMTNDAKQPSSATSHRKRPVELRERSSYRTWLHARARLGSGADFGGPLRATVRFLEFASRYTIDRRG